MSRQRPVLRYLHLFWLCLLAGLGCNAWAQPLQIGTLSDDQHAGRYSEYLRENAQPLQLEEVVRLFQQGHGEPGESPILNLGIGSQPVWLHLQLNNPSDQPVRASITAGASWVDELQLSLLQSGKLLDQWQAGDAIAGAHDLVPGIGFVATMRIPTGSSDLYLRAASPDPLILPLQVLPEAVFTGRLLEYRFVYGLIYGFLLSMIVYNSMLFIGLRDRNYLYYSIYLSLFGLLNFAYTGHGFAWLWPDNPGLQNHSILSILVLFNCSGLAFCSSFLSLDQHAPRYQRLLQGLAAFGLGGQLLSVLLGNSTAEAAVALTFTLLTTLAMTLLPFTSLRRGDSKDRYFLIASLCGTIGTAISLSAIAGVLPFTSWSYGAIKIGLILQAAILALALSKRVRSQHNHRLRAERLAGRDPLTGLHNRRGFNEHATILWSNALRSQRPLSLVMLDLDHFKTINDLHGHTAGDHALELTARLLEKSCRAGDVVARWGGEEFLLMLPEAGLDEAVALAERLRQEIQNLALGNDAPGYRLSASFGVIERSAHEHLEQMINQADRLLYAAKHSGRNRVCA